MAEEINIIILIEEVRKYRAIWDITCEDYRDKSKKKAAWLKVCPRISSDFNVMSKAEKHKCCNRIMNKWRNLKDNFRRNLRRKARLKNNAENHKNYIHAEYLSFLLSITPTRLTQETIDLCSEESDPLDIETESTTQSQTESILDTSEDGTLSSQSPVTSCDDLKSSLIHFMNTQNVDKPQDVETIDEDRAFFESLIPTIKLFTVDQKLEFRSETLNLIKRIRMIRSSKINSTCTNPHSSRVLSNNCTYGPSNNANVKNLRSYYDNSSSIVLRSDKMSPGRAASCSTNDLTFSNPVDTSCKRITSSPVSEGSGGSNENNIEADVCKFYVVDSSTTSAD